MTKQGRESEAKRPTRAKTGQRKPIKPSWTEFVRLADQAVAAFAGAVMINRTKPRACGYSRRSIRLDEKWPETDERQLLRQTKPGRVSERRRRTRLASSRTGENPPYGMNRGGGGNEGKTWCPSATMLERAETQEANFTMVIGGFGANTPDRVRKQLELCQKYDLGAIASMCGLPAEELLTGPACWGYLVADEPNVSQFADLAKKTSAIGKARPGLEPFMNLYPDYADKALGVDTYDDDYLIGVFKHQNGRRSVLLNNCRLEYSAWPTVEFDVPANQVIEADKMTGKEHLVIDDSPDMPGLQISLDAGDGRLFLLPPAPQ